MPLDSKIDSTTRRIRQRSRKTRAPYVEHMQRTLGEGISQVHLSCGNQAHAYAAMGQDKRRLACSDAPNLAIITSYCDMLSTHQPYERFPRFIKDAVRQSGGTVPVAGGIGRLIGGLLDVGFLHEDVRTVFGGGLRNRSKEPKFRNGTLVRESGNNRTENGRIDRSVSEPFASTGGLGTLAGHLGRGIIKISVVKPEHHLIEAPARTFSDQGSVRAAFDRGELNRDGIIVVRFQGTKANGMPELHARTPLLSVLLNRGHRVGLITDGRMSGASGRVLAAIHVAPEAADGGAISKVRDGGLVRLDAAAGRFDVLADGIDSRTPATGPCADAEGYGRELFNLFRSKVGSANTGASANLGGGDP